MLRGKSCANFKKVEEIYYYTKLSIRPAYKSSSRSEPKPKIGEFCRKERMRIRNSWFLDIWKYLVSAAAANIHQRTSTGSPIGAWGQVGRSQAGGPGDKGLVSSHNMHKENAELLLRSWSKSFVSSRNAAF